MLWISEFDRIWPDQMGLRIFTNMIKARSLIALFLTFLFSDFAMAQCQTTGSTPDGGDVVECSGVEPGPVELTQFADKVTIFPDADIGSPAATFDLISLNGGDNEVLVLGGSMQTDSSFSADCIDFEAPGTHTIVVEDGLFECQEGITVESGTGTASLIATVNGGMFNVTEEAINNSTGGDDVVLITGGTLIADEGTIQLENGNDTVTITGGTLVHTGVTDEVIDMGSGNDVISLSNTLIDGTITEMDVAIGAGPDDDKVILGNGAEVIGIIDGTHPGLNPDSDTLIFDMEVPGNQIGSLCAEIAAQGDEGQITINGLLYVWASFENVRCQLKPQGSLPIPTLGPSGLALMILVLLGVGLIAFRRIA